MKSILDLLNRLAGKHRVSPGTSNGTLTDPSVSHAAEKEEDEDIADTKATSGANDATATTTVRIAVQVAA